jgi:pimeloyl-ACP methyl ester carboxylesterase
VLAGAGKFGDALEDGSMYGLRPMAEQFCDVGRGVTLCYETFGDPGDPTALLVMGLGVQMIGWREEFCEELAGRGFHVVRFDNRDAGRSTHFPARPPSVGQLLRRKFPPEQYTLSDMAEDTAGLLRELQLGPAHVIGASMGGMIGQMLAAEHPDQVRTLTSIMSTTGSRLKGQPSLALYRFLLKRAPSERDAYIDHTAAIFEAIGSPGMFNEQDVRDLAARSFDRDDDRNASGRQLAAILASGNRTAALRRITAPTLVMHGTKDRLVAPSGGRATAKAIPTARLMAVDGMGHDLPRQLWPRLIDAIEQHARSAGEVHQAV